VRVERLEVVAGLLRQVVDASGTTKDVGAPRRITVAVLRPGDDQASSKCTWSLKGKIDAGGSRTYDFKSCASCGACFKRALGFKCGDAFHVRVQAKGSGKKLLASAWSPDHEWRGACSGDAGVKCYT
jgi:hypothetical protein